MPALLLVCLLGSSLVWSTANDQTEAERDASEGCQHWTGCAEGLETVGRVDDIEVRSGGRHWATIREDGSVRIGGSTVGQIREDGTVRKRGSSVGSVRSNGSIRRGGQTIGEVRSDGTLRMGGSSVGRITSSGDIRIDGQGWGRASNCDDESSIRKVTALLVFFADVFDD